MSRAYEEMYSKGPLHKTCQLLYNYILVKIGPFGDSNVNWYANKRRIQAKNYT